VARASRPWTTRRMRAPLQFMPLPSAN